MRISKLPCSSKQLSMEGGNFLFKLSAFPMLRFHFWLNLLFREMGRLRTYYSVFQFLVQIKSHICLLCCFIIVYSFQYKKKTSHAYYKINSYWINLLAQVLKKPKQQISLIKRESEQNSFSKFVRMILIQKRTSLLSLIVCIWYWVTLKVNS